MADTTYNDPSVPDAGDLDGDEVWAVVDDPSGSPSDAYTTPARIATYIGTAYLSNTTFNANSIVKADSDDTPVVLEVGEATIIARQTGGNIAAVAQVSSGEKTAGTETELRGFSPDDIKDMIDAHGAAGNTFWDFSPYGVLPSAITASPSYTFGSTVDRTITFTDFSITWYVATTNNASNYWVLTLEQLDGTDVNIIDTSGGTNNTWTLGNDSSFLVASSGSADAGLLITITKVNSPGAISLMSPKLKVTI